MTTAAKPRARAVPDSPPSARSPHLANLLQRQDDLPRLFLVGAALQGKSVKTRKGTASGGWGKRHTGTVIHTPVLEKAASSHWHALQPAPRTLPHLTHVAGALILARGPAATAATATGRGRGGRGTCACSAWDGKLGTPGQQHISPYGGAERHLRYALCRLCMRQGMCLCCHAPLQNVRTQPAYRTGPVPGSPPMPVNCLPV